MANEVLVGNASSQIVQRRQTKVVEASDWPCSEILKRVFIGRGVTQPQFLNYSLSSLYPPNTLKHGSDACELVVGAVVSGKSILILGDYDTDGATAVSLGLLALREMGAENIDYLVPNRFEYGYGLSPGIAEVAIQHHPDLVITVDNGINSVDGVNLLRQAGIDVLITDHHLPSDQLPNANAILNPNQKDCQFPGKNLAGVGVMFYLLMLVRAQLKVSGWFKKTGSPVPNLARYLDLVALGTVADLVVLDYNNRILVDQGLKRIRSGQCRPGIIALLEVTGRHYQSVVSSDFGFVVAPRLNAAGRLEDISLGIECLISNSGSTAKSLAEQLDSMNKRRRSLEQDMQVQAVKIVEKLEKETLSSNQAEELSGICLYDASWHQGITGLVASRIKDRTAKPVIAFAQTTDGRLTGSARSVEGLHIRDLLEEIQAKNPQLIDKFGGHSMAAGLTLSASRLAEFQAQFASATQKHFSLSNDPDVLITDGLIPSMELDLELAEEIRTISPWGQGFPVPLFEGRFTVSTSRLVGDIHLKMSLICGKTGKSFDAIAFRAVNKGETFPRSG